LPFTAVQHQTEALSLEQVRQAMEGDEQCVAEQAVALDRDRKLETAQEREWQRSQRNSQEERELAQSQLQRDERERKSLQINHQHQWRNLEELEKTRAYNDRIADDRLAETRAKEDAEFARKNGGIIGGIKGLFNPSLVRERDAEKERIAEQRQHEDARRLSERRERDALARTLLTEAQQRDKEQAEMARKARNAMEQEQQHERQREREAREIEEAARAREERGEDDLGQDWELDMEL